MYKNQIIVLVQKDGQPLRETDGKFVYLPFNSEYSIDIKNQSYKRAVASIKIDGTDVLGGDEIIIPAYGTVNLERFISNGDLTKGKKFKFVPLSDSKVQDPSSPENGLVEIECWFEQPTLHFWYTPPVIRQWEWGSGSGYTVTNAAGIVYSNSLRNRSAGTANKSITPDSATVASFCCSADFGARSVSSGQAGATVEGGESKQSFMKGAFGQKEYPSTTFKFWLRGVEKEVTTEDKLYCTNCGKKTRFDYKFCPRCGTPVRIA